MPRFALILETPHAHDRFAFPLHGGVRKADTAHEAVERYEADGGYWPYSQGLLAIPLDEDGSPRVGGTIKRFVKRPSTGVTIEERN